MKKKKILTLALVAILAVGAVTSASLAYFTDKKTAKNTFTMGNVSIVLDEAAVDKNGKKLTGDDADRVKGGIQYGPDAVFPGAVLDKDPTVTNDGYNGAYIRATVNVSDWMNICAALYPDFDKTFGSDGYEDSLELLVGTLGEGWSVIDVTVGDTFTIGQFDAKFILKYDGVLAKDESTTPIFEHVYVPVGITNASASCLNEINIVAEAIQENSFNSWEQAFNAYDGKTENPN